MIFAASTVSRVYLLLSLSLVLIAVLPSLSGWHATVVQSGSMEPHISPGDVVHTVPLPEDEPVPVGGVVEYESPAEAEPSGESRTRLHRIVTANDDGTFITAGDANTDVDSVPLERHQITGQARLLVPRIGLPGLWLGNGQWTPLTAWVLLTAVALAAATIRPPADREEETDDGDVGDRDGEEGRLPLQDPDEQHVYDLSEEILGSPASERSMNQAGILGRRSLLVLGGASLAGFAFLPRDEAIAGFSARTLSTGSSWSVAVQAPLTLGRIAGYALFAATSITNLGLLGLGSNVYGSVGTSPGTSISGFGLFTVSGSIDRNTTGTRNARTDALTLYTEAAARPRTGTVPPTLTGTLAPGVYESTGSSLTVSSTLTLDGRGDTGSIFILRANTFTAATNSTVRLINGASADRVFWVIGRTITLNAGSTNRGTYLSDGNAAVQRDATLEGRVISLSGYITIAYATIYLPR